VPTAKKFHKEEEEEIGEEEQVAGVEVS